MTAGRLPWDIHRGYMSYFEQLFGYTDLVNSFIRPYRETYKLSQLGPSLFLLGDRKYTRTDFCLLNDRGLKLACSHFEPKKRPVERLPCVVYLHGNCSSRLESLNCVPVLLPLNVTVFCFDFSGSGLSDGEYVSLGWFERDDLSTVVKYLRTEGMASHIGFWGRSMGAITALMEVHRDSSISGVVVDSAFSSLNALSHEIASKTISLPYFLLETAISVIRKSIFKRAKFDINEISPISIVHEIYVPAVFAFASEDDFIHPRHTHMLHSAYSGDKMLNSFVGNHNTRRPDTFTFSAAGFFYSRLDVAELPVLVPRSLREPDECS